jgi:hypothetical protein
MTLLSAIHGILTSQTDPSWPDRLDAWMAARDPQIKVLKKEYAAGPFPVWNCFFKDHQLAQSLANELELFLAVRHGSALPAPVPQPSQPALTENRSPVQLLRSEDGTRNTEHIPPSPQLGFISHSNGAVIALRAASLLIQKGHRIDTMIFTGAAIESDITKNCILTWLQTGALNRAITYSSPDDEVLPGPMLQRPAIFRDIYSALAWPYGSLGRTGWTLHGVPIKGSSGCAATASEITCSVAPSARLAVVPQARDEGGSPQAFPNSEDRMLNTEHSLLTRFYPGGHSAYFSPPQIDQTFDQIHADLTL